MIRIPASLLLLSITATLLASCSSSTPAVVATPADPQVVVTVPPNAMPDPTVDHPGQVAPRFDFVATVPLQTGDTVESMQAASGGTVVSWGTTNCSTQTCQALIGLNATETGVSPSASTLSTAMNRTVTVDSNRGEYGAGGTITAVMGGSKIAWAGGSLLAWSGGSKIAWAGGSYSPIPQNTPTWTAIRLEQAQSKAPNLGAGVVVAVIDTGLDLNHMAFQGALTDAASWWDFYGGDAVPQDEGTLGTGGYGHGTNVAGIILQIAPKAKIMPLRVLGPDGSGDVASIVSAINWAVAHGANIINLSLGSSTDVRSINDALLSAAKKNILAVASAGNDNKNRLTYPAQNGFLMPSLVSVASVDRLGAKSSFSNYGYQTKVVAPGETVFAPAPGNMMAGWSGTSQAAPMVAGGLALAMGQKLRVSILALPGAVSYTANNNIYGISTNWSYPAQLGSGQLNLAELIDKTVK